MGRRRSWATERLFDHLVCLHQQTRWDSEAEFLGGFHVDDEFKFGRLHNRQIAYPRSLNNLGRIDTGLTIAISKVRPICD
jgi:hypothetical protein